MKIIPEDNNTIFIEGDNIKLRIQHNNFRGGDEVFHVYCKGSDKVANHINKPENIVDRDNLSHFIFIKEGD